MFRNRNTRYLGPSRPLNPLCEPVASAGLPGSVSRWMYVLSFTGGSNAGGGRINTPSPEAAMPEVDEKNKPTG